MIDFTGMLGPERFLNQFHGHIIRGESVICVIPECERFRAEPFLRSEVGQRGFDCVPVEVTTVSELPDAIAAAANLPPVKDNIRRLAATLTSLMDSSSAPHRPVVFVPLTADETGLAIANAIGEAYPALRCVEASRRPRICLSVPHSMAPELRNSTVREDIKTLQWGSYVVDHDIRTVVTEGMADFELPRFSTRLIGEVIAELSLWDLDCAHTMLGREIRSGEDIDAALSAYAAQCGWTAETPDSVDEGTRGMCNGVEETHSAALLLRGKMDELAKRVWRAQLGIVLPELDEIRLYIINRYQSLLKDANVGEVDLIDYGQLCTTLFSNQSRVDRRDLDVIDWCRYQRNELSHLKPVQMTALLNWPHWEYARRGS
jgi:hypothetical protein